MKGTERLVVENEFTWLADTNSHFVQDLRVKATFFVCKKVVPIPIKTRKAKTQLIPL